jgi:hypothetical protein
VKDFDPVKALNDRFKARHDVLSAKRPEFAARMSTAIKEAHEKDSAAVVKKRAPKTKAARSIRTEEELTEYILIRARHQYDVFMSRITTLSVDHWARCAQFVGTFMPELVKLKLLVRFNVVTDARLNNLVTLEDGDIVCRVIYETKWGLIRAVTLCMDPKHIPPDEAATPGYNLHSIKDPQNAG